ncbi:hypothetical protein ABK040_004633 [Willaertia magna]
MTTNEITFPNKKVTKIVNSSLVDNAIPAGHEVYVIQNGDDKSNFMVKINGVVKKLSSLERNMNFAFTREPDTLMEVMMFSGVGVDVKHRLTKRLYYKNEYKIKLIPVLSYSNKTYFGVYNELDYNKGSVYTNKNIMIEFTDTDIGEVKENLIRIQGKTTIIICFFNPCLAKLYTKLKDKLIDIQVSTKNIGFKFSKKLLGNDGNPTVLQSNLNTVLNSETDLMFGVWNDISNNIYFDIGL